VHILVSSFAAVAGVVLAAYQAFAPSQAPQQPLAVTVAVAPDVADAVVEKSDAAAGPGSGAFDLARDARLTAALNDGSDRRYDFGRLFDGEVTTYLTVAAPDRELNVLVTFAAGRAEPVNAVTYVPPAGIDASRLATVVDVMVLPEGQMEASGRPVMSFALQTTPGSQTFVIPDKATGKGVWLRIAGRPGSADLVVGDFRILGQN